MADEAAKLQVQYDSLQARLRLAKEGRLQSHSSPDHHYGRQPYRGAGSGRVARPRAFPNKKLVLNEPTTSNHSDTNTTPPIARQDMDPTSTNLRVKSTPAPSPAVLTAKPNHTTSVADSATTGIKREIVVEGIRFRMKEDGSKLHRVDGEGNDKYDQSLGHHELNSTDPLNAALTTPKQVFIAGIEFLRSKSGNLLRKTAINPSARYDTCSSSRTAFRSLQDINFRPAHSTKPQCINFTKNGTCYDGPKCKYTHDPKKVAICKTYFRTGDCADGTRCDLSHKPTYERVPACSHFLNGN
ncbi:hypothetical protein LTR95_017264, partial [Oleoguttula sp. CCFEE 5521]